MPIDPGPAVDAIQVLGFPVAVAVVAIGLGAAALWYQRKQHLGELERMKESYVERAKDSGHRLIDAQTAASVWQQLYATEKAERQANGREVAEQLKTLDLAIELIHRRST
jgi:hypothetical protein